jgi:hypothetical protein
MPGTYIGQDVNSVLFAFTSTIITAVISRYADDRCEFDFLFSLVVFQRSAKWATAA